MNNDKRDNFTDAVKNKLAKRVMYLCSNPNCRKITIGPDSKNGINNIGVAAHICAAAPGGPRYDGNMSEEQRKSIDNGIWLCQSCAKLIDSDEGKYTVNLIKLWRDQTENIVSYNFGKRIVLSQKNKLEYIFETLKDTENWAEIRDENVDGYYYKENPSYTIEIVDENNHNTEFYSYLMTNKRTSFYMLYLKYNDTCIYSKQIVSLDSGRLKTIVPLSEFIDYNKNVYKLKYYIKNSKEVILRDFLLNYKNECDNSEELFALRRFNEVLIEFESEDEFKEFKNNYINKIDFDEVKHLGSKYTYAGNTDLEIKNNQIDYVYVTNIENVEKNVKYYHVVSTRYYNIIANDILTTDDAVVLSNLYILYLPWRKGHSYVCQNRYRSNHWRKGSDR